MKIKNIQVKDILELKTDKGQTIREYLHLLLVTLWIKGESFSGKRPFGNSRWEYDLYRPLVKAGIVKGSINEEFVYLEIDDNHDAYAIIFQCIDYCFNIKNYNEDFPSQATRKESHQHQVNDTWLLDQPIPAALADKQKLPKIE